MKARWEHTKIKTIEKYTVALLVPTYLYTKTAFRCAKVSENRSFTTQIVNVRITLSQWGVSERNWMTFRFRL